MNGRRAVRGQQGAGRRHGGRTETEPKTNREAGTW